MKRIISIGAFLMMSSLFALGISPYLKVAELKGDMGTAREKVESVLRENGYEVIGRYQPGGSSNLSVVVFTNDKIKSFCLSAKGRGMLAAAMKVGFQKRDGKINVSILNPEYLFYAYFRDKMDNSTFKSSALAISSDIKSTMRGVGTLQQPFGGDLSSKDLKKYHYMMGMPYFDDPVKLAEFGSFQQGVSTIQRNLTSGKGNTLKVYEIIDEQNNIAVFGIGLPDKEEGEAHFLPIIGESHIAAMPYEIILQNKKVTMLHGRYRFALHWPELTMKTFTKIMSSPGDVEDAMKALVK
ncbi:MAG: hypothetical protein ABFS38_02180 [Bacteroidota bacterium]